MDVWMYAERRPVRSIIGSGSLVDVVVDMDSNGGGLAGGWDPDPTSQRSSAWASARARGGAKQSEARRA